MATYRVDKADGSTSPVTIAPKGIDTSATDVALFGRGRFDYGEALNENLVHLLENFASKGITGTGTTPSELLDAIADRSPDDNWAINSPITGQTWHNKTDGRPYVRAGVHNKWDQLSAMGDVTVLHGTIAHGEQIPLPVSANGYVYTQEECAWIVAPAQITNPPGSGSNAPRSIAFTVSTDANRYVTASHSTRPAGGGGAVTPNVPMPPVNYMIVGIKDNVNVGDNTDPTANEMQSSQMFIYTNPFPVAHPTVTGGTNQEITATVDISVHNANGQLIPPSQIEYEWTRVEESSNGNTCALGTYSTPIESPIGSGRFMFVGTSSIPGTCFTTWRLNVTVAGIGTSSTQVVVSHEFVLPASEILLSVQPIITAVPVEAGDTSIVDLSATYAGGTGPYTIEWGSNAIDGSGAELVPGSVTNSNNVTTAKYRLTKTSPQLVYTRVRVRVTDSAGYSATGFVTIKYTFLESSTPLPPVSPDPIELLLSVPGGVPESDTSTREAFVLTGEEYILADPGADTRSFTVTVNATATNIPNIAGGRYYITRLRDANNSQFNLTTPSVVVDAESASFTFAITANTAIAYPGVNTDAWRLSYEASDGRIVSRDIITRFNYLNATSPLAVTVADVQANAFSADKAYPDPTYVTLKANVTGGTGPYSYDWVLPNASKFKIVGPRNGPTLTLMLRGTTFNHAEAEEVVWPSHAPGANPFVYQVAATVTVTDGSTPVAQQVSRTATAGIKFDIDTVNSPLRISPVYQYVTPDAMSSVQPLAPFTQRGCWLSNPDYLSLAEDHFYRTFSNVSLNPTGGSGVYNTVWTLVSETGPGGTVVVFGDGSDYSKRVHFRAGNTAHVTGQLNLEAVWRADVTDTHTGQTIQHTETVKITACRAQAGSINNQVMMVPCNSGANCS